MKLIIAGSRNLSISSSELDRLISISGFKPTEIVSGKATGIDYCGEVWAQDHQLRIKAFPANWGKYGRRAGPMRNSEMAIYADALLAFPGNGRGTWDMISRMQALEKPLAVFDLYNERWVEDWEY